MSVLTVALTIAITITLHKSNSSEGCMPECPLSGAKVPFKTKSKDLSLTEYVVVVEGPNFVSVGVKYISFSLSCTIEKLGFFLITTLLDRRCLFYCFNWGPSKKDTQVYKTSHNPLLSH